MTHSLIDQSDYVASTPFFERSRSQQTHISVLTSQMQYLHAFFSVYDRATCDVSTSASFIVCSRDGQQARDQELHFSLCYHKEPHHTHGHTWTSPHLFLTHTHTSAQLDLS